MTHGLQILACGPPVNRIISVIPMPPDTTSAYLTSLSPQNPSVLPLSKLTLQCVSSMFSTRFSSNVPARNSLASCSRWNAICLSICCWRVGLSINLPVWARPTILLTVWKRWIHLISMRSMIVVPLCYRLGGKSGWFISTRMSFARQTSSFGLNFTPILW